MEVFNNVNKIAEYVKVSHNELRPILLAALFHDTGNAIRFQGHEEVSAAYSKLYMEKNGYDENIINEVHDCIKATKLPQIPINIGEKIICDADLFHLGTKSYISKNELLRAEWEKYRKIKYSDKEWDALNINFLEQHQYFANYGMEILEPVKQENINKLKRHLFKA
ncbi:HD domain-containing protein [Pareuzebyella sediminis]|uniref:HD domain-containing protein n=1 Tax=Pareuzebyella sediminis TaxID=2607998 RepID=UPI0018E1373A|nr:HD domain-containing protein [Pareuzebyella sediminis]